MRRAIVEDPMLQPWASMVTKIATDLVCGPLFRIVVGGEMAGELQLVVHLDE